MVEKYISDSMQEEKASEVLVTYKFPNELKSISIDSVIGVEGDEKVVVV